MERGREQSWSRVLNPVLRHPVISLLLSAGLLVLLALPALRLHTANESVESLPQDVASIQTYNRIQDVFPGGGSQLGGGQLCERPDTGGQAGHRSPGGSGQGQSAVRAPITLDTFPDPKVTQVTSRSWERHRLAVECRAGRAARHASSRRRSERCRASTADVTGFTAESKDFNDVDQVARSRSCSRSS